MNEDEEEEWSMLNAGMFVADKTNAGQASLITATATKGLVLI